MMDGRSVLITGHMGFIGSWLAYFMAFNGYKVLGIDNRASYGERLYDVGGLDRIMSRSIVGDISDYDCLAEFIEQSRPQLVMHLAGQAIIPRAFRNPRETFLANAVGTLNTLDACRECDSVEAVSIVTSDKVYENTGAGAAFSESDPLGGSDIYSISKSSAELISKAYKNSHVTNDAFNIQTIRLGNVLGGGDWSKNRLLPDLVNAAVNENEFRVRYLDAQRPFQHILDVITGIKAITESASQSIIASGESWNLGPRDNSSATVREVIEIFESDFQKVSVVPEPNQVKEDLLLSVKVDKYARAFGKPRYTSHEAIRRAIIWYRSFYDGKKAIELIEQEIAG